jgi:Flp pilus assembly protein TadD
VVERPDELEERIAAFAAMVRDDPADPVAQFSYGQALSARARFAEAVTAFEAVIALSPGYSAAYRGLGRALEALGRRDDARAAYTRGIDAACAAGDLQTKKEMEVFLARLDSNR